MNFKPIVNNYLNFIDSLLSHTSQKGVVGFDIGTSSVKAVQGASIDGSFQIQKWAVEPIVTGNALEALKKVSSLLQVKDQIPVAAISGKGTLIRYVEMPRMSLEELRKSLVYEIDKYFPFDPQTIYTDCCIVDQNTDKRMLVLVVAVKKELVDERLKLFKEAGLDLNYVTTNAIATANAFERLVKTQSKQGAKAILDMGGSISNLMILDNNNSPCFTRDIFVGGQEISKQIANALRVDPAKADQLKVSPGERLNEVVQACEGCFDNLINEIHLSFDYFMTEKNATVTELFLVGGGAMFKGIEGTFEKGLNIPVKSWNPLMGLRLGPEVKNSDINIFSSQLAVAIGLALSKV